MSLDPKRLTTTVILTLQVAMAGMGLAGHAAAGTEHTVIILGRSYFPKVSYVGDGDQIRFVNESGFDHVVTADRNAWTTGILGPGEEVVVPVTRQMQGRFFGDRNKTVEGSLLFGPSPLGN